MKNYKSMRGVNIDLAKLMAKADKSISVGNTQTNARGDQLGRGGRVIKSADEIARDHTGKSISCRSATSRTPASMTKPLTPRTCAEVASRSPK